ncbi:MAG TPA: hypothetical protein VEX86_16265 [Longimicrobium sp.]|nr:hypothetical protein [Longimicrobium sp.]
MLAPVMAGLLLAGCLSPVGVGCTAIGRFAVNVEVRDSASGAAAADGATLVIREGEYADSVVSAIGIQVPPVLAAGAERPGTYQVTVRKNGYQPWTREGVRVGREGRCDELQSARLTARLMR